MRKNLTTLIALALFSVGAWLLLSVAYALISSANETLPWFSAGIAIFSILLIVSGICVFSHRWKLALLPLTIALTLSAVRWLGNLHYVFPFASNEVISKTQRTLLIEVWQSQQFLLMSFVAVCWLIAIRAVFGKTGSAANRAL